MKRYQVRVSGLVSAAALAIVLGAGSSAGVAHAEPGPRPTLTPVPPVAAPTVPDAPAAPAAPREEAVAAPTPKPRRMIMAVVTPIAPVRPTGAAGEPAAQAPVVVEGTNVDVRYVAPAEVATAPMVATTNTGANGLLGYRSLLVSLIALDIMGVCMLLRRRFATK